MRVSKYFTLLRLSPQPLKLTIVLFLATVLHISVTSRILCLTLNLDFRAYFYYSHLRSLELKERGLKQANTSMSY